MKYYSDCLTVAAVKLRFRKLAMENHPDKGGDTATMQNIIAAYHAALGAMDGQESHDDAGRVHSYHYQHDREQGIADKVAELISAKMPDHVEVWIIGLWVWILGTKREDLHARESLKAAHCVWHSKRCCWYWRPSELKHRGHSKRGLSGLAARYGAHMADKGGEILAIA